MTYDFTTLIDRRGMDALAVDGLGHSPGFSPMAPKAGFDPIPMWVADMSFPTCPAVTQAVVRRAQHPLYGYFEPPQGYFDAICRWHATRHGVTGLTAHHIGYENGVLGGVVSTLRALCAPGEPVLLHSPTYVGFTHALEDNGHPAVLSPLVLDRDGVWRMDLADMEDKLTRHAIHLLILCSPHNPCGRVWERWELEAVLALCRKHQVFVLSDEIWSDILRPGLSHIPTQSLGEDARARTVALYAPSKTFNLAGLVGSYHIIYDPWLRDRVTRRGMSTHYNHMNVLSTHALMAAYSPEGADWTDQLNAVLRDNVDFACGYIAQHLPGLTLSPPQGTYMLFVDCTGYCAATGATLDQVLHRCWEVGVAVQDGRPFHGPCHIRMNLALPRQRVEEAFDRMRRHVFL